MRMKALEDEEHTFCVLRVDPDAVVRDGNQPFAISALGPNVYFWRFIISVLDCIAEKVLEKLAHLSWVGIDGR